MRKAYLACTVGIVAVSFAATFIRIADAHPIIIAFMRMALSSLALLVMWQTTNREYPSSRDIPYLMGAGIFLALHFVTWIGSLGLTSVASSVVLVTMQPLFVLALSTFIFKETIRYQDVIGICLCLIGALSIAWSDMHTGGKSTIQGNALALSGAAFSALYFICGKKVRGRLHILPYVTITYSVAALTLGAIVLALGLPMGPFSPSSWFAFLGLALVCTMIGHSAFNYAIAYLPASTVSVATLGEPIGATILAAILLKETPTLGQVAGGVITIAGIYVFSAKPSRKLPKMHKLE